MSFPSVAKIAEARGINLATLSPDNPQDEALAEEILVGALRIDCPLACKYLHGLVHRADNENQTIRFVEDPNSELGKQIIRIAASDAARRAVTKHIMHGREWVFLNCCGGLVPKEGEPKPRISAIDQLQHQAGPHAYADC